MRVLSGLKRRFLALLQKIWKVICVSHSTIQNMILSFLIIRKGIYRTQLLFEIISRQQMLPFCPEFSCTFRYWSFPSLNFRKWLICVEIPVRKLRLTKMNNVGGEKSLYISHFRIMLLYVLFTYQNSWKNIVSTGQHLAWILATV